MLSKLVYVAFHRLWDYLDLFFLYGNCLLDRSSNTVLRVVLCTVLFVFLVAKTSSEEDELEEEDIQNDSFARLSKEFSQNMDNFLELLLPYEPSCPSVCQLAARSVCLLQFSKKAHIFLIKGVQLKLARGGRNILSCAREACAKNPPPLGMIFAPSGHPFPPFLLN